MRQPVRYSRLESKAAVASHSIWNELPPMLLPSARLYSIVVAVICICDSVPGLASQQTWLDGYLQSANTLVTACELPTHASINLDQGRWPWNVQVLPSRHGDVFAMASNLPPVRSIEGTLISWKHVLTTSIDIGPAWEKLKIRFRTNNGQDLYVDVKRRFVLNDTTLGSSNFAILELQNEVNYPTFPKEIKPVCILSPIILSNKTNEQLVDMRPTLSAFANSNINNLCQVNVKFISEEQCHQELESLTGTRVNLSTFVCDDNDKCNDLVGSIAMVQESDDQRFQFVGMLTFVYNEYATGASYPSLYQRLTTEHITWIDRVFRARN